MGIDYAKMGAGREMQPLLSRAKAGVFTRGIEPVVSQKKVFVRFSLLTDQSKRLLQLVESTRPVPRNARCDAVEPRRSRAASTIARATRTVKKDKLLRPLLHTTTTTDVQDSLHRRERLLERRHRRVELAALLQSGDDTVLVEAREGRRRRI